MMGFGKRKRSALKFEVRTRLIPHLYSLGFERPHTKAVRPRWPPYVPESTYGRIVGERADFLDVYWDKYGAPKFKLFVDCLTVDSMHSSEFQMREIPEILSGHYGLPWGLLGFGGVWFGPGQSAQQAVDLAIRRVTEWDQARNSADRAPLARIEKRGFLERTGPAAWWLRHAKTDVPQLLIRFCERIYGLPPA